jgi:hypothetical protein
MKTVHVLLDPTKVKKLGKSTDSTFECIQQPMELDSVIDKLVQSVIRLRFFSNCDILLVRTRWSDFSSFCLLYPSTLRF